MSTIGKTSPADVAQAMRKEAQKTTGKGPSIRIVRGWKFGLSYGLVPLPERAVVDELKGPVAARLGHPALGTASYEEFVTAMAVAEATGHYEREWIFSASLHPRGRSSTEQDWQFLGQMLAALRAPEDSCRTPLETTHPNAVHYWSWIDAVPG